MLTCKSTPRETGIFILQIQNQVWLTGMCPTLQLAGGVGEGLTPQVIPITLPAVLLMRRNELGRGICLYRKVEGRGQLVRVDLLTPFSMGVQGNKQVVRFGRKYPYAELSHWSTLVSFMVCDLLSFFLPRLSL